MKTEMTPKEPVVKLLREIKGNLDDMGKAAVAGKNFNQAAAALICATFSGKIEQFLESIDEG